LGDWRGLPGQRVDQPPTTAGCHTPVPRPARQRGKAAAPVVWEWRQRAASVLTRQFFEREYLQAGKTLRELETETGFPRKFLAERARQHGITVTGAYDPAPIDPDWLREQYLTRHRSYTDLASELGVLDVTVIAAARRHGIPSRPPGVHSRPEMITTLGGHVPPDIRRAVEGGLKGWHRLHRFQAAMTFPTIEAAATFLGAHQSALVHQFRRLERDIEAKLYQRSAPGRPMRPTARGTALLKALNRPDIRALAAQPPGSGPAGAAASSLEHMGAGSTAGPSSRQ
jgi:Bacterial regulatory helix-turn-helix protein, lysR family